MKKPNLPEATNDELIAYIEYQETLLNGSTQFEQQISRTCSLLSSDMENINNGKTEDLTILSLDDNILKKLMFTIKNKDFFMGKSNLPVSRVKGKVVEMEIITETKDGTSENVNAFEEVSKKIKANLNGTK